MVFVLSLLVVSSCGTARRAAVTEHVDSVRVEYRERLVRDTAYFSVPQIVERNVTTDTMSFLENEWAKSDAIICDGILSHSLETRPHVVKVPVTITVRDTVIIEKAADVIVEYKEKPLTKRQERLILWGKISVLLAAFFVGSAIIKFLLKIAS